MASILSYAKYFQFALANAELAAEAADVAERLKAAPTFESKWEILKAFGDRIAPKADELAAIINGQVPRSLPKLRTVDEMRTELLKQIEQREQGQPLGTRAADVKPPRDGRWLNAGIEVFRLLLPLLTQLATK